MGKRRQRRNQRRDQRKSRRNQRKSRGANDLIAKNIRIDKELRQLKERHERVNRNIQHLQNQINDYNTKIRDIENDIAKGKGGIRRFINGINREKERIRTYNRKIKTLKETKNTLDDEIMDLTTQIATLEKTLELLKQDNGILESDFDTTMTEHHKVKGLSWENTEQMFDMITTQNNHLHREYSYLKNDLTQGDQESTFIQPDIENSELTNHFFKVAYYIFAIILLVFLYKHFSMDRIYSSLFIISAVVLYPYYITYIEEFVYFYIMYMYNFIRAEPVK
jgi:peptidoglycan hydrolase CwlO-like protein